MNRVIPIAIFLATLIFQRCAPPPAQSVDTGVYEENLAVHRTQYVEPSYALYNVVNEDENTLTPLTSPKNSIKTELDSVFSIVKNELNNVQFIRGLTIQLYTGNDRDNANNVKNRVYQTFDDLIPRVSYDQPNYKVRVGKYYNRLDANEDFTKLKKVFPQAILVPDRILIESEE